MTWRKQRFGKDAKIMEHVDALALKEVTEECLRINSGCGDGFEGEVSRRQFMSATVAFAASSLLDKGAIAQYFSRKSSIDLQIAPCELEVAPGHRIKTIAYNSSFPENVIRIPEGKSIDVQIRNDSQVEEYVHWHGFALNASLDGTQEEGSLSIQANSKIQYTLPPQSSGSYYVHSHAMTHHSLEAGVYSGRFAFVYVDPLQNSGRYDKEIFLTSHEWEPYFMNEAQEASSLEEMHHVRLDTDDEDEMIGDGWDVQYRLASLNGKALGHGEPIRVKAGERVLFHLLNASATRNIQLALPGHKFLVLGLDGHQVTKPALLEVLDMGVGERIDAIAEMSMPGIWILGSTDEDSRSKGLGVVVEYAGQQGKPVWSNIIGPAWDYGIFGDEKNEPAGELISLRLCRLPLKKDGFEHWAIVNDGQKASISGPHELKQGRRYRLKVKNDSDECHPMHLHRYSFGITNYRGRSTSGILKDTVMVFPYEEVELTVTPKSTGPTLFHCHNQMHMNAGLQTLFNVYA